MPDTYRVTVNGEEYEVDANSVEEAQAKAQAAASNAAPPTGPALSGVEAISETPSFQRDIEVPTGFAGGNIRLGIKPGETATLPFSPEDVTEAIPSGMSALAAILTKSPAAAGAASGAGEAVRMALRKMMGFAPATGIAQKTLDLDPNSPEAMLVNLVTEGGAGALTQGASNLAVKGSSELASKAPMVYSKLFGAKTQREHRKLAQKITPIIDELPINNPFRHRSGRDKLEDIASAKASEVAKRYEDVYNTTDPSSFTPARDALVGKADELVRTPGDWAYTVQPDGTVLKEWVEADIKNPTKYKAMRSRAQAMNKAQSTRDTLGHPVTRADIFEARKTADEIAKAEKSFAPSRKAAENTPAVQALGVERSALSKTLHEETKDATGKSIGKEIDDLFSAWKTVETGAQKQDPANFLIRWTTGRQVPGRTGTSLGALTTRTAFWTSLSAKGRIALAKALKAGDRAGAAHILRATLDTSGKTEQEQP